jgi:hypothetical protein
MALSSFLITAFPSQLQLKFTSIGLKISPDLELFKYGCILILYLLAIKISVSREN